ncbi:MAG: hypothetical protein JWM99_449 [Verrucomicrobiales bacterium]|nr:hypothetical protein [Verrucomicrobiales bacterium]
MGTCRRHCDESLAAAGARMGANAIREKVNVRNAGLFPGPRYATCDLFHFLV